jgi:hypothetical protein
VPSMILPTINSPSLCSRSHVSAVLESMRNHSLTISGTGVEEARGGIRVVVNGVAVRTGQRGAQYPPIQPESMIRTVQDPVQATRESVRENNHLRHKKSLVTKHSGPCQGVTRTPGANGSIKTGVDGLASMTQD